LPTSARPRRPARKRDWKIKKALLAERLGVFSLNLVV
jgi:hypothetical protein